MNSKKAKRYPTVPFRNGVNTISTQIQMVRSIPFGSGTNFIKSSKPKVQLPATSNSLTTHQNINMESVIENGTLPNYRYPANPNNLPLCNPYLNAGTYTYTNHNLDSMQWKQTSYRSSNLGAGHRNSKGEKHNHKWIKKWGEMFFLKKNRIQVRK